jgi:glycerophosphoryl diester phosphodiesterase
LENIKPLNIGHRGAMGVAPENTLASFAIAIKQGAQAIELDVQMSNDGELLVCHDDSLNRTTDRHGYIRDLNARDIRTADAGAWFADSFAGEKIPFLEEVLQLIPTEIMVNIEVKETKDSRMMQRLVELLNDYGRMQHSVISTFDHKWLVKCKRQFPDAQVGLLYAVDLMDHSAYAASLGIDVYSLHPRFDMISDIDIHNARKRGLAVFPYTVNEEVEMRRLVQQQVTGIITDYPAVLDEVKGTCYFV